MLKPMLLLVVVMRCQTLAKAWIPRNVTMGHADYSFVTISPDGRYLSYLQLWENTQNLFVRRLPDGEPQRLTSETNYSILDYGWTFQQNTIYYRKQRRPRDKYRLLLLDVETGESRTLMKNSKASIYVRAKSSKLPDMLVIRTNDRDSRFYDYYRINMTSGQTEMILRNEHGHVGHKVDDDLQLVMISKEHPNASVTYYIRSETNRSEFVPVRKFDIEDERSICIKYDTKHRVIYWLDTSFGDKSAIVAEFLNNRARHVIFRGNRSDLSYFIHPVSGKFVLIAENYLKPTVVWEDESFAKDFNILRNQFPNKDVSIAGYSEDFLLWLVGVESDVHSTNLYLYNLTSGNVTYLLSYRKELDNYELSPMVPVEIPVSDDLIQVCYLVLPRSSDPNKTGRPDKPLPTVLMVHGGPWARVKWGLDLKMQHWASRGYAALNCNFRGSTGLGKRFLTASFGEWGRKMQQDLVDAVHWAIAENIADPSKVAIVGHSYGGYAALAGMTFTPDLFACGVSFAGLSNMITSLSSNMPAQWTPFRSGYIRRVGGDPDTDEGRTILASISPVYLAHRIKHPLLLIHGTADTVVKLDESSQMVAALYENNARFTYATFANEHHNFIRHENKLAQAAVTEVFLSSCLGGQVEPLEHGILSRSSVTIS